jgi:hypothetical protein
MEPSADPIGHGDLVGQNYGGGWATRKGMERATETKRRLAGCTQRANPILSIPAIVASNPGDFGQGRVGARHTGASRSLTLLACFLCLLLVPCLPAVRYLRQHLANSLNVFVAPSINE